MSACLKHLLGHIVLTFVEYYLEGSDYEGRNRYADQIREKGDEIFKESHERFFLKTVVFSREESIVYEEEEHS